MSSLNDAMVQPHFPASIETNIKDKNQQYHQRSLPKGPMMARVEISQAVNMPWKVYKMSTDINVLMLTGTNSNMGCSGVTTNLMRKTNQLLSYCVAALSYARIYTERNWKPKDIDKIIDIGWNINRRGLMKRPMNLEKQTKMNDLTDVFYIDSIKFVTMTKALTTTELIDKEDMVSVNVFCANLQQNGQESCILKYDQNYCSLWHSNDKYYIFHPMSVYHKTPKCVQFSSFDWVEKYFVEMLLDAQTAYSFHSVDILKINDQEVLKHYYREVTPGSPKRAPLADECCIDLSNVPHKMCLLPNEQQLQQASSYESLSQSKDVLRCPKTVDRSAKIPSTCVAAVVVLRVNKPNGWTSNTLDDILALGSKIYKQNIKLQPQGHTEIRVSDITQKIEFGSFQCVIESQQIFFGKVESTVANVCNVEQGLIQFFKSYIAGVVDGPNIVGIWKESNYFYMFDPKARDRFGRKWTKDANKPEEKGMSCVTRFEQLKDLVEIYVANIPQKERHDYYKITHIELKPYLGKNWFEWKATLPGTWCLRGQENFHFKSTFNVAIMALLYAGESGSTKNWKSSTIDEIASTGSEDCYNFNANSSMNEIKKEIVFKEKTLLVHINRNMFRYVVNELDTNIEDDLVKGFFLFFEANKEGIFSFNTSKNIKYFSVWKSSDNWFTFGLHVMRDEPTGNEKREVLCALRFTSHVDLVKSLTADIIIRKNQEYSLSLVTISQADEQKNKTQMNNYEPLAKGCAGILRIGKNIDLIGNNADADRAILKRTYYITSVIAMTLIKDCWIWSSYDVWDILKIAQKSFSERFKEVGKFSIKIGSTTIKIKESQTFLGELEDEKERGGGEEDSKTKIIKEIKEEIQKEMKEGTKKGTNKDIIEEIQKETKNGIKKEIKNEIKSENHDSELIDERSVIEAFLQKLHDLPYGILNSKQSPLAFWKRGESFFVFDLQDADENGVTNMQTNNSNSYCPYVAWFDSIDALLQHILTNLSGTENGSYEFVSLNFRTKVVKNVEHKSWYNFSLVDDGSDQWMIRSLYGSLQNHYGLAGCIIALVFATTLQPSDWNSSMIDNALKYGIKLYKKSLKTDPTKSVLKLNKIVSPFICGCYIFSFTSGLFKCGANEQDFLENGIGNLFNVADYGIISSKGYSAAIWQQNHSYFVFDPNVDGMACLSRFANIALISKHFLSHVSIGLTGVNVFELYKVSISRNDLKKNDCPVDIEAISKLTNRSVPINESINQNIDNPRIFGTPTDSTHWREFKDNPPTECFVVAACLMGSYKNPEYWTANEIDEILSIGKQIVLTTVEKCNLDYEPKTLRIQPHQIQGMYPFDQRNDVNIRMELFKRADDTKNLKADDLSLKENLKATLAKFFEIWDNAFLSTEDARVSAWKQGVRFYLFYCQSVDENGRLSSIGETKGAILTFISLVELYAFLEENFGANGLQNWFEIRYVDFSFIAVQKKERMDNQETVSACCRKLNESVCHCSSNSDEHVNKHVGLCLAAIVMSTICDIKEWSNKLLSQIEEIGKALYDDAVIASQTKQITIEDMPYAIYVEHVEYIIDISIDDIKYDLDEATLTKMITKQFERSAMLYVSIETSSFSLIAKEQTFFWYDPNGVDDEENKMRSSVCCFSSMKLLIDHILKLGLILNNDKFCVYFVKCSSV